MKKEDLKARTREVIEDAVERIVNKIDHSINSGAMDVEGADDDYLLPKMLAKALLRDAENSIGEPIGAGKREFRDEVDKIYAMI